MTNGSWMSKGMNILSQLGRRRGLHKGDWFAEVERSLSENGLLSPCGDPLPTFPDTTLQKNTTGLDGIAALQQAFCFYQDTLNGMNTCGSGLSKDSLVLDFGVGWGRISRFFLRDTRLKNIYGVDVDPDFVALCRRLFGTNNFQVCASMPPTSLKEGTFSLITAYSVYSHLSEEACLAWLAEFRRLLKPGGCFAFTTRHESFFDYLKHMRDNRANVESYSRALGELFPDLAVVRQRYAQGELVHASSLGVSGGGVRNESFYGETFIPEQYVRTHFTEGFELVSHSFDSSRYDQMFYLLRKK